MAKERSLVIIAHHPTAPFETDSVRSDRLGIEQAVAGPELAATLDQLKRPQPSQGVVEAATVRSYPALIATSSLVSGSGYTWVSISRISRSALPNRPRQ